jgi:choline dehydrogenase-like flavoprotein
MKQITEQYDVVVCGGGLAGFSAAVAAARHGAKTCLVQDRPVFGGNSSSEVRVTVHGAAAFNAYARETGIISELLIEERARNHELIRENGWTNSVWDLTMYDMAMNTPNLTFHVNTTIFAVQKNARTIAAVVGRIANAETEVTFQAKLFIDCTGDGIVADLAGCESRMGSEARDEFGEPHAPEKASRDTMGSSIHFKAKDMGYPVPFTAPDWAVKHDDARYFYEQGRDPSKTIHSGYWWLEIGVPWDTIYQAEDIRHELTRHTLGVWDWIKNKDPKLKERAANFALDWIGQVPGKRESRRILGRYWMTEHDPLNHTVFPDEIAFGGWFIDLHTPGGLLAATSEPASAENYNAMSHHTAKSYIAPYGIP